MGNRPSLWFEAQLSRRSSSLGLLGPLQPCSFCNWAPPSQALALRHPWSVAAFQGPVLDEAPPVGHVLIGRDEEQALRAESASPFGQLLITVFGCWQHPVFWVSQMGRIL